MTLRATQSLPANLSCVSSSSKRTPEELLCLDEESKVGLRERLIPAVLRGSFPSVIAKFANFLVTYAAMIAVSMSSNFHERLLMYISLFTGLALHAILGYCELCEERANLIKEGFDKRSTLSSLTDCEVFPRFSIRRDEQPWSILSQRCNDDLAILWLAMRNIKMTKFSSLTSLRDSCWKLRKCGEHFNQIMFLYVVDSINFMDFDYADELDASEYKQALRDNTQ